MRTAGSSPSTSFERVLYFRRSFASPSGSLPINGVYGVLVRGSTVPSGKVRSAGYVEDYQAHAGRRDTLAMKPILVMGITVRAPWRHR